MPKCAIALVITTALLVMCSQGVHATTPSATVTVTWTNPSTGLQWDQSTNTYTEVPLTDLDHVTIYWQRCGGNPPQMVGAMAGSLVVPTTAAGAAMSASITISLPKPVCFELTATDTAGLTSNPSNIAVWGAGAMPTLGQPVQLN
jgi:hypothetical protein